MVTPQNKKTKQQGFIEEIAAYRAFLMEENPTLLAQVFQEWNELQIPKEQQDELLETILLGVEKYDYWTYELRDSLIHHHPKELAEKVTLRHVETIAQNRDLLDLIGIGILKKDYPFEVNTDFSWLEELTFYEIENHQNIGEIGAGNGMFCTAMALYNKTINLYINELDSWWMYYIDKKFSKYNDGFLIDRIHYVYGKEKKTKFKKQSMDKIILRKTFHHFTEPELILASIKKSLKANGILYINESLPRLNPDDFLCEDIMTEEAIKSALKKAGFVLKEEMILGGRLIMKYIVTN